MAITLHGLHRLSLPHCAEPLISYIDIHIPLILVAYCFPSRRGHARHELSTSSTLCFSLTNAFRHSHDVRRRHYCRLFIFTTYYEWVMPLFSFSKYALCTSIARALMLPQKWKSQYTKKISAMQPKVISAELGQFRIRSQAFIFSICIRRDALHIMSISTAIPPIATPIWYCIIFRQPCIAPRKWLFLFVGSARLRNNIISLS